ncbi:MAG: hypothetical protein U0Q18_02295 [Bryobacteraceae bacterium]
MTRQQFLQLCAGGMATPLAPSYSAATAGSTVLRNDAGLVWTPKHTASGWVFGSLECAGKPVDNSIQRGMLFIHNLHTGEDRWLPASELKQLDARTAVASGSTSVDGVTLRFELKMALSGDICAAALTFHWSVDRDLTGWEVCCSFCEAGMYEWRCTLYPFAGDSQEIRRDRLSYIGVPAALMFRDDGASGLLFGIDPASDYLNPHSWTGSTGFHFRDLTLAPQFRACAGRISAGTEHTFPLQLFISAGQDRTDAITHLVRAWIGFNRYKVEPLHVRTPDEALALYVDARRTTPMWQPGKGYQIEDAWPAVYIAEIPISAYFDYLLWEQTSERMWRDRAFESADFLVKAQHLDASDPHYGVIETNYELDTGRFTSRDHTPIVGYRVDMNAFAARYLLMLWERVREREGLDRAEWRTAALRMAEWILKQQNPDGGLPQYVDYRTGRKSISVVSGRALLAMPVIYRVTGEAKYRKLGEDLERFLRERVESRYWFTGQHPDLWPKDYESDSVWCAAEYWLDRYERTKDASALKRAEADAWLAFLMWCPRQLSWVKNPTQTCHAEQEHYLQYSNYCYNNRKIECLFRLGKFTGERLFTDLGERIMQSGFWAQETKGPYRGGQHERMSDPWHGVSNDVNSTGEIYFSELALDASLQLLEMGKARARR